MARTKQTNKEFSVNVVVEDPTIEILNKPRKFTAIYVADKTLALGVGGVASSIEEARKITDEKLFKQGYNLTNEHKISVTFHD